MCPISNLTDLVTQLAGAPAVVALRGEGRTTGQTETWITHRLVPTLAQLGFIDFPLEISLADRPDLRLEMPGGTAGIEITEVVPLAYAEADAIRNKNYPGAVVDRSLFTWGVQFTPAEIHKHLSQVGQKLTGPGWAGDSVEREWARAVNAAIVTKTEKLNRPGFTICQWNWLAAYTSAPGPALEIAHATKFLELPPAVPGGHSFDCVFVLTDHKMAVLRTGASADVADLVRIET